MTCPRARQGGADTEQHGQVDAIYTEPWVEEVPDQCSPKCEQGGVGAH